MKAFTLRRYGKEEKLHLTEVMDPVLKEREILVQIHAASVNVLDSKIKTGEFKLVLPYKPPFILGHDVAGVVAKVGSRVTRFKIGDEIYARPRDNSIGAFAELIAINEGDAAIKPKNISMEEAASMPLVALTVWQAFTEKSDLKKGQKVFIQAGSGGVGTFAIQLAKHFGATVATTTSEANISFVKTLGADIVIDYRKEDFETILHGYDIVLNSQDQKTLEKSLRVLRPGGKLISISGPPDIDFAKQLSAPWYIEIVMKLLSFGVKRKAKRLGVHFSSLLMRAQGEHLNKITKLIESGVVKPVVDKVFPFEQTNEALSYLETGRAKGKVVIKIR
jgi:NADPH:quinone reductase-like Zn-dependent oxidoreductase